MAKNLGKWPSGHGQLTKIMPSDGCKGDAVTLAVRRRCNLGMIAMDLEAIWKMSVLCGHLR